MSHILLLLTLFFGLFQATTKPKQSLGLSKDEIIKEHGEYYGEGVDPDGKKYINYSEVKKGTGEDFRQSRVYYFDDKDICNSMIIVDPVAERKNWEARLTKSFTKVGPVMWKEFIKEKEIVWKIENQESFVILHLYYGSPLERTNSN